MKNFWRISLFGLIGVILVAFLFLLPTEAQAAEELVSGTCGENLTWILTDDGVLTISGTGEMDDYFYSFMNYPYRYTYPWYFNRDKITSIIIHDGVTSIGNCAFAGCYNATEITIPASVTEIGDEAFYCCAMTEIKLPDGPLTIGREAFADCSKLKELLIPSGTVSIGEEAFSRSGLTSITAADCPEGTVTIGEEAFAYCESLTHITLGERPLAMGVSAFIGCMNLTVLEPGGKSQYGLN